MYFLSLPMTQRRLHRRESHMTRFLPCVSEVFLFDFSNKSVFTGRDNQPFNHPQPGSQVQSVVQHLPRNLPGTV